MNYERGLARLQNHLKGTDDEQIVQQITSLEAQLRDLLKRRVSNPNDTNPHQELQSVVDDSNIVAYRVAGTSFDDLCNSPQQGFSKSTLSLSLSRVLLLLLIVLFLPGIGITLVSMVEAAEQRQVEQIRQDTQAIDTRIGNTITSFFYLNHAHPCYDSTLERIMTTNDLSVQLSFSDTQIPLHCAWEYKDAKFDEVIAQDLWELDGQSGSLLQTRVYYKHGSVIARDSFDWQDNSCFKHREYLDDHQIFFEECYSEAGKLLTQETRNIWISPVPPMVYWFFYW